MKIRRANTSRRVGTRGVRRHHVEPQRQVFGSIRVRHFGPRPLIEDAWVRSAGTTLWNAELGYRFSRKARLLVEMFNLFDAKVADIDYYTHPDCSVSRRRASKKCTPIQHCRDLRALALNSRFEATRDLLPLAVSARVEPR